ncbi:MAG: DNA polymerase III subunit gamma/tau [Gammaproteobacteria bacterium]|nr:DNA polymerase III subunit gamma/tau [Gammaproteobacteria bacterium]
MSYLVLARKYRPRTFHDVKGQEHTVRALVNALDNGRLHHAYLFSGTRGVGKTTLGRILANCLNCEAGVSSQPCFECASCNAFADGSFIDLVEVDAASRTGVDDMRQLLENASLRPSMGRFRVYLIDEVHMLSNSSFNALLKTLEEPPDHVKFVLATTDPKKIPVTVLSRCLQFHLTNISPETVREQLTEVLDQEDVSAEQEALEVIARAADGSMRDALSIVDQAISHGGGSIALENVSEMLGTARTDEVERILELIVAGERKDILEFIQGISTRAVNYSDLIASLQRAIHAMSLYHITGEIDDESLIPCAERLSPEWLQVAYQILVIGMRDLRFAPDHRTGFDMTILRLLDFEPVAAYPTTTQSSRGERHPSAEDDNTNSSNVEGLERTESGAAKSNSPASPDSASEVQRAQVESSAPSAEIRADTSPTGWTESQPWHETVANLDLQMELRQHLIFTELVERNGMEVSLRAPPNHEEFWTDSRIEEVNSALKKLYRSKYSTSLEYAETQSETPAQYLDRVRIEAAQKARERRRQEARDLDERKKLAQEELENDSFVQSLKKHFGARILDIQLH